MSTSDDRRPVPPDFDRRRMPLSTPSPAASPPRGCRTPTAEQMAYRGQPVSPGRPHPNGYQNEVQQHQKQPVQQHQRDPSQRSPLRSSVYQGPQMHQSSSSGARRTTTQFVYPCHSSVGMDSVTEKMKDMSTDDDHGIKHRSWTRSMDLGGLFPRMTEDCPQFLFKEAVKKECLRSAPLESDRHESEDGHEPRNSAMLDAYWHKQQDNDDRHNSPSPAMLQRQPSWHPDTSFLGSPRMTDSSEIDYGQQQIRKNRSQTALNKRRENPMSSTNGTREIETSVAQLMKRCQFLEAESQYLREREVELREDLCRARAENAAISAELRRTHDLYREALSARRNAREALSEMAQQNARLVSAYVEKKQEFRNLQESFDEECRRWRSEVDNLQTDLTAAREAQAANSPSFSDSDTVTTGVSMTRSSDEEDSFPVCFSKVMHSKQENGKHVATKAVTSTSEDVHERALQELRLENIRLQEENEKLKQQCEDVEKEKEKSDAFQKAQQVEQLKKRGNIAFGERKWDDAIASYSEAIGIGIEDVRMMAVLHCNRASCYINTERLLEAVADCYRSILLDSSYYKGYMRRADALTMLGDHASALQDLRVVVMAKCTDSDDAREKMRLVQSRLRSGHVLDPYKTLCVAEDAHASEIRMAYKKLALRYHPDKADVKEAAAAVFKMVSEANSILSDEDRRREYDMRKAALWNRRGI